MEILLNQYLQDLAAKRTQLLAISSEQGLTAVVERHNAKETEANTFTTNCLINFYQYRLIDQITKDLTEIVKKDKEKTMAKVPLGKVVDVQAGVMGAGV
jgi:hypothetical protein